MEKKKVEKDSKMTEEKKRYKDAAQQMTKFIGTFEKLDDKDIDEIPKLLKVVANPNFEIDDLKVCHNIAKKTIKGILANKDKFANTRDKDEKIKELTEILQRLQADTENYQKRCEKQNAEFRNYASAQIIDKLLPLLDSFELALKNTANKEEFIKGVELIYSQLYDLMEKEGLRKIEAKGGKFDPYKHEVLLSEKTDKEEKDGLIVEELQKGYMFKDKVLRYSKVKVLKK